MAPYTDLLLSMEPREMLIVMSFLQEALSEIAPDAVEMSAAETIRNKYKNLTISQETKDLVRGLSLSLDEMKDERVQHILGY